MRALPTTLALNRELREYLALQKTKIKRVVTLRVAHT